VWVSVTRRGGGARVLRVPCWVCSGCGLRVLGAVGVRGCVLGVLFWVCVGAVSAGEGRGRRCWRRWVECVGI